MEILDPTALDIWLADAVVKEASARIAVAIGRLEERLRPEIEIALHDSEAWNSLLGGRLRDELGLENPAATLAEIASVVAASAAFTPTRPSPDELGGITVEVVRQDFLDVLNVSGSSYESIGKRGSHEIPWLEWMLFGGDDVQVIGSFVHSFGAAKAASRTGHALMVTSKRGDKSWSVPAEFSGVKEDNFLTRAIGERVDTLLQIMGEELLEAFR